MAEITTSSSGHKPGVRKSKKHSTRVDLTPMVDLGFLLITFFVFTTSMSKPTALKLNTPAPAPADMEVAMSTALTVIPLANDKILYYHGAIEDAFKNNLHGITTYFYADGIGSVIRNKQQALIQMGKQRDDIMLIVKPSNESSLGNAVDILDEVLINLITRYSFTDLTEEEKKFLAARNIRL